MAADVSTLLARLSNAAAAAPPSTPPPARPAVSPRQSPEPPRAAPEPSERPPVETMRLDVGIHADIPENVYHRDCAIEVSASSSILRTIQTESPRHAKYAHPRLNPKWEPEEPSADMIKGTILHSMLLDTPKPYRVFDHKSWQSNAAKADQAQCFADGMIPVLSHKLEELQDCADGARELLKSEMPKVWEALTDPETINEATLIFRRSGVMCRGRVDALVPDKYGALYDFKFTGRSAEPDAWGKMMRDKYLFQPVMYPEAIEELRGDYVELVYIVVEWDPPYGISLHSLAPDLFDIAKQNLDDALELWKACLKANRWRGYPTQIHYHESPGWMKSQREGRTIARAALQEAERRRLDAVQRFQSKTGTPAR